MTCGSASKDRYGWRERKLDRDRAGCWREDIKMGGRKRGMTDDSRGLHWSASELWMTKYGAVRRPAGKLFQGLVLSGASGI